MLILIKWGNALELFFNQVNNFFVQQSILIGPSPKK
jgi:hypothetical protein